MSMMKRYVSLLLVLCFMLVAAPVTAYAATGGSCGENVTWSLEDGVLTISGTGPMADYSNKLDVPWIYDSNSIFSVIIENGVTSIGYNAFYWCDSMTDIIIPDSITSISNGTFSGCFNLTSVTIGNGVTSIGYNAFSGCTALTDIIIPDNVTIIREDAFSGCTRLTGIWVDASNPNYCNDTYGVLYNKDKTQLVRAPGAISDSYTIPDSVTSIGNYSFEACSSLSAIIIPDSITSIGHAAFSDCSSLSSITIPDGVTSIDPFAFSGCTRLTNIIIPDSVTSIGWDAFSGCSRLTEITIPDSVTSIATSAFMYCTGLTSIIIPASVTSIGFAAFFDCSGLTEITIPESVTSIGEVAFYNCSGLSEITFSGNAPTIASDAFSNVIAMAYYPAGNATWTDEVMQDYGGTITWVPYNSEPGDVENPGDTIEYHDTILKLTELDFLAFSQVAYEDFDDFIDGETLQDYLTRQNGKNGKNKWNDTPWEGSNYTYSQLCRYIANWTVCRFRRNTDSGFYAVVFKNNSGEVIIAYRGSTSLLELFKDKDAQKDWLINDFPMIIFNSILDNNQYKDAIEMYEITMKYHTPTDIIVTGHSLGGGLADIISAAYGCRAESVNAISVLDIMYYQLPELFAENFEGVDRWKITDHANENDALAGVFEEKFSTRIKPYKAYKSLTSSPVASHLLDSYITENQDGSMSLTKEQYCFYPTDPISKPITKALGKIICTIDLGTSGKDTFNNTYALKSNGTSYGGDGNDEIIGGPNNDKIIGGAGNDLLDGGWGSDTYYYHKNNGLDTIMDVSGDDKLYLEGFDAEDIIEVSEYDEDSDFISVSCNGKTIVYIYKGSRAYSIATLDSFKVYVNGGEENDITDLFSKYLYGSRLLIHCPVSVEVLDTEGNVVYTLNDGEVGSYYTEYGNFYIYEEEDGSFGKALDLREGYTVQIVGEDSGTMDVVYQDVVNGELDESKQVTDVPVSESFAATIQENDEGKLVLIVDNDNDGIADEETVFAEHNYTPVVTEPTCTEGGYTTYTCACGDSYVDDAVDALGHDYVGGICARCGDIFQNPFSDVPSGSFYEAPVLWALENDITNGATANTFDPNGSCLRAHVVTFLHRAAGNPAPSSDRNPFTDVPAGVFFYQPVLWAVEKGVTNGTSATTFGSYDNCNRAAVVTFLWRAAGSPEPTSTNNPFVDVASTAFYYKAVLWAVENGITNGVDATHFGPTANCTRAQVVTFLYRAYKQ